MSKQSSYDQLVHQLNTDLLAASNLKTKPEQQGFVNRTFTSLHKARQEKRVSQPEYVKLLNRLAAYAGGAYNDYIDMLAGAAQLGMLELAIQGEMSQFSPEQARKQRDIVTGMTGMQPHKPETGTDKQREEE
jgi:hypothetical protein